jgi:predicted amidohydrolase
VQLNSNGDKARNLAVAERLVRAAAADGAELVALPEKWNLLAAGEEMAAGAEDLDGASLAAARSWARQLGIHLLAGSIAERAADGGKAFNTSVLIGPDGADLAAYRKIHMFDVEAGGVAYRESDHEQAGEEIVSASLDGLELGLTVCYDLRFPELYRILAVRGARLIAAPVGLHGGDRRDHWQVLLRARAIENQVFLIAPNQVGEAPPHYSSHGARRSSIRGGSCSPPAPDEECFVAADLDLGGRSGSASGCLRWPAAAPGLPLAAAAGGARLMASRKPPADRQAPPDPRRGDPRLRPPGLPLDPRRRHRRRGGGRLRPRLPLLQVEGRGAERALQRALVAALAAIEEADRRRGDSARPSSRRSPASSSSPTATNPELMKVIIVEVTRAANSFGRTHLAEIRRAYDSIARSSPTGRRRASSAATSTPTSPRCPSTARSSSCSPVGSSS